MQVWLNILIFPGLILTPEAILNIRLIFALLPAAFVLVGGLFVLRHPIREKDAEAVKEKLAARHHALEEKSK